MITFENINYWPDTTKPLTAQLKNDNWDDYGFKTTFNLFVTTSTSEKFELGLVKIITKSMQPGRTSVPPMFYMLPENYCSLGQSQDYYEKLYALPQELRENILSGLRDCVFNESVWDEFKNDNAMTASLLRSVDEFSAKSTYRNILNGISAPTNYNFRLSTTVHDDNNGIQLDFSVCPGSMPPSNVHVLIGRNGVGKTSILAELVKAITNGDRISGGTSFLEFIPSLAHNFYRQGRFSNLVAVAFSAFDQFTPIDNEQISGDMRYSYVGLRSETPPTASSGDLKTQREINSEFARSLAQSLNGPRHARWVQIVKSLNTDPGFAELELHELTVTGKEEIGHAVSRFNNLSSGHRLVLLTAAKLVELVDERTLVLIDEPESHLHPPLLSSLMRALSDLLSLRNGVAIVATHSPVVLQEVPASCVSILRRTGKTLSVSRPKIQTFAENVGTLTREVFQLEVTESGYHKLLRDASQGKSYEEVLGLFGDQIGSEGRAIARTLTIKNN